MKRYASWTWLVAGALAGSIVLLVGSARAAVPPAPAVSGQTAPAPVTPGPAAPAETPPAPAPPAPTLPPLPALSQPALPAGVPSPIPLGRPLSLQEAVALAMYQQPQIAISAGAAAAAAARVRQTASGLLPSANISASATRFGPTGGGTFIGPGGNLVSTGGGTGQNYSTSISAQQLLFDFGRTPASVAQARSLAQSAQAGFGQTRQDVLNQVKQTYYSLLQNQRLVDVQRANVADQQAHLELAQARFAAGVAPRSDVIRAETAVASAIYDYVTAEQTAAISRVTLNTAIGIDLRTPTMVQDTEEPAPLESTDLVAQALANRPDVVQLRANVHAAEEALRAARTTSLPDVVLSASYGLRGSDFPPDTRSWSYGVSLQWPFLNVGLTSGRIEEARANLQTTQAQLRQTELTVASDVLQAYLNAQAAEQKVTSAAAEVRNAEESLSLATGRYQAGVAAYIEVIDAEAALVQARTNQVNALYGSSIARAALARALGVAEL